MMLRPDVLLTWSSAKSGNREATKRLECSSRLRSAGGASVPPSAPGSGETIAFAGVSTSTRVDSFRRCKSNVPVAARSSGGFPRNTSAKNVEEPAPAHATPRDAASPSEGVETSFKPPGATACSSTSPNAPDAPPRARVERGGDMSRANLERRARKNSRERRRERANDARPRHRSARWFAVVRFATRARASTREDTGRFRVPSSRDPSHPPRDTSEILRIRTRAKLWLSSSEPAAINQEIRVYERLWRTMPR